MGKIKPTFSLVSNSSAATDPGPLSVALNLTAVPIDSGRLTVDTVTSKIWTISTTTPVLLLDGSAVMAGLSDSTYNPGVNGTYIYMKNTATTGTDHIYIGLVSSCNPAGSSDSLTGTDTPAAPATGGGTTSNLDGTSNKSLRTFTLKAGEFAFFPWDFLGDIYAGVNAGATEELEMWRFDRG